MLNNKLIKRVVTVENEWQEFAWLGKQLAESNRSIGSHFCCTGLGYRDCSLDATFYTQWYKGYLDIQYYCLY